MVVNLEDGETLDYLNEQRDSNETQKDWWHDLTNEQKSGIARGLKDVEEGRVSSHQDIKIAYGL
jgi:predicted transcriptional regulator